MKALRSFVFGAAFAAAGLVHATITLSEDPAEAARRDLLRSEALALENGEGIERDAERAAKLYCEAAKLGDAESQFNLGWMYANGKGVDRSDATAAFFFHAAAEQGLPQAQRMLERVGGPPLFIPECMQNPPPPVLQSKPGVKARAPKAPIGPETIRSSAPTYLVELVKKLAPEYKLSPQLVLTFIETESRFDVAALSPKNAKGLMQLIPDTAARFGVRNAYDATQNVRGGMAYLRWLMAYFEGDVMLVAAAYNAGEGAVNRYLGIPPYAETRAYVLRILAGYERVAHPFDASVTDPSPQIRRLRLLRPR